jgi:AcrR family transcriptional regulator
MGRPREHDQETAAALLEAAERIVQESGLEALSVRGVADEVGTTTRAVYSLFGSKRALVLALCTRTFQTLGASVRALATTEDPAADLVEAGLSVFRRFAIEHPALFRLFIQQAAPASRSWSSSAAGEAFGGLEIRVTQLKDAGLLGPRTVRDAATEFHALCEGLAALELRGLMAPGEAERIWRDALTTLVSGFVVPVRPKS